MIEDSLSVCRSFAASSSDATLPTPTFEIKIQRIDGSSQRVDVSADMRPDFFRSWGTGGGSMMGGKVWLETRCLETRGGSLKCPACFRWKGRYMDMVTVQFTWQWFSQGFLIWMRMVGNGSWDK